MYIGLLSEFHFGPSLVSASELLATTSNSSPLEGTITTTTEATTATTTITTTSKVSVTIETSDVVDSLTNEKIDDILSNDVSKLVQFEELDEENDAKLFWDVVNSIQQWQQHKQQLEQMKKHGGLTR